MKCSKPRGTWNASDLDTATSFLDEIDHAIAELIENPKMCGAFAFTDTENIQSQFLNIRFGIERTKRESMW
jgi:hypothetical protein